MSTPLKPWVSDSPKSDCLYGMSGTGKTTQIGRMARFIYKKSKKLTRLISADAGGWKTIDPYIRVGIVQPFSLLDERVITPLDSMVKLVQGYWPFDPETGEPLLRTVSAEGPLKGKQVFDFTNIKAKPTARTWERVGGLAIEGLHSISTYILNYLSANPAMLNELAGGAGSKQGAISKIQDGSDVYVQPGQASYGFVQKKMYDLVKQSCDLPLEKVVWTSLEALYEVKDKEGNVQATEHYYPSIIGKAALRSTPSWYGMLLHLETVQLGITKEERPDKVKRLPDAVVGLTTTEVRAYLKDHTSARDGLTFKAKSRFPLEVVTECPNSFRVTLTNNDPTVKVYDLCSLYELEDELQARATEMVRADLGIAI